MVLGAAAGLAAFAATACIPPPSDDVLPEFKDERLVKKIQRAGVIRIGVPSDLPYIGVTNGSDARPVEAAGRGMGFAGDVGTWVATELDVKPLFIPAPRSELLSLLTRRRADVVFPDLPITERTARKNTFSNPYYVTHQRLLVKARSGVRGIEDLAGKKVCSAVDPRTEVALDELNSAIDVIEASGAEECSELLETGEVQAVTSADIYLLSAAGSPGGYEIVGEQLSTEGLGGVVELGASGFADFVDAVIYDAIQDGRWSKSYLRWIAPFTRQEPQPPRLTAEEAAALFPIRMPVSKGAAGP